MKVSTNLITVTTLLALSLSGGACFKKAKLNSHSAQDDKSSDEAENDGEELSDDASVGDHKKAKHAKNKHSAETESEEFTAQPVFGTGEIHQECLSFLRSFADDRYFYQFQSNHKKDLKTNKPYDRLLAHMKYRAIVADSKIAETQAQACSEVLLSLHRYGDIMVIKGQPDRDAMSYIASKLALKDLPQTVFPLRSCAQVVGRVKSEQEYKDLVKKISSTEPASEIAMVELMRKEHTAQKNLLGREISAKSCVQAIRKLESFAAIKEFTAKNFQAQYDYLYSFSWKRPANEMLAH